MQLYSVKELLSFKKLFQDSAILSGGTNDSWDWMNARDALVQNSALEYLRNNDPEFVFQAIQLCQLGDSDWNDYESKLQMLRDGIKLPHYMDNKVWDGAWCLVLQTIFNANWDKIEEFSSKYFLPSKNEIYNSTKKV